MRHWFDSDSVRHTLPTESPGLLCAMAGFVLGAGFPSTDPAQSLLGSET